MKKTMILILLILGMVACQQNTSQESEVNDLSNKAKSPNQVATKYCTKDLKICPDGNSVARNPQNNCEFEVCAKTTKSESKNKEPVNCTADVKECPDGSFVGRDHFNNCRFKECQVDGIPKDKVQ